MSNITAEQARVAVDAALRKARELGVKMNIAVASAGAAAIA